MASYNVPVSFPQPRDLLSQTSDDEEDNNSPHTAPPPSRKSRTRIATAGGGSEIEINRGKPRGRPPGSKNKPKPAVVVTKESDSAMKTAVLEIAAGSDIIETVARFARRHQLSVTIISGSGSVSNITLRHPTSHAPSLSLRGPFKLVSLTGTFLGSSSSSYYSSSFGISLAGQHGRVVGGVVGGKVTAASPVVLVVATFTKPSYHKLSGETDQEAAVDQPRPRVGGGGGGANERHSGTSMSMSAYNDPIMASPTPSNCHAAAPEVMNWTTAPRCPPPPY